MSQQIPDKGLSGICGHNLFTKCMRLRILLKRVPLLVVILLGLTLFIALLLYSVPKNSTQNSSAMRVESSTTISSVEQANSGLLARLKIPKINVDAAIESVGLTSDGAMDAPKERTGVAWFNLGSRPGENGSAVIAGHYGWKNGEASVFDNLYKLRKGDTLYIEDEEGVIISFVVREMRTYDKDEDASDVFSSLDGKSHLNLITCEGVWDKVFKTYSKRLVVFTDKE
jgi:LPXTG-site transpeptidase (sortase) family protein